MRQIQRRAASLVRVVGKAARNFADAFRAGAAPLERDLGLRAAPRTWAIAATSLVLCILWLYPGKPVFYDRYLDPLLPALSSRLALEPRALYHVLATFVLFGVVPALVVRAGFRTPLERFGIARGDLRASGAISAGALAVVLPLLYFGAADPALRAEYPIARRAADSAGALLLWEACYLLYYLGWESFFRGYMLFGLEAAIGPFAANLLQTFASTLVHAGKPASETLAAAAAGMLFGAAALRTRSILAPLATHYALGAANDIFCVLRGGP